MGVNIQDRRRVSSLIEDEFRVKINEASRKITDEEISDEELIVLRRHKLSEKVARLEKAREAVHALERELSVSLDHIRVSKTPRKKRGNSCECYEDFEYVLHEIAKENLQSRRAIGNSEEKIRTEKRRLLARVEIAKSVDDLEKIVKQAGLI